MLGDLNKLLHLGFIRSEYVFASTEGEYRFQMRNLTVSEINDVTEEVKKNYGSTDVENQNLQWTFEALARSVEKVNNVALESLPEAVGDTAIEKRKSLLKRLAPGVQLGLNKEFEKISAKVEDVSNDDVKKPPATP